MPRPPRLHVPGGYYHVILRGNHREPLFGSDADRNELNDIIADVIGRFSVRVHAFCWMTNHLHAVLEVAEHPLGEIVQRVAQRYARYRHKQLRTTGHLFERRHKAKLVDVDGYFLALLRYIHLNPVKAKLVTDPAAYPWSSHRAFLGEELIPWLTIDFGLSLFANDLAVARRAYGDFVCARSEEPDQDLEDESRFEDSRILGTTKFVSVMTQNSTPPHGALTLVELARSICRSRAVSIDQLRSPSRAKPLSDARAELATQATSQSIATLSEVARFLNRAPSTVSELVERHRTIRRSV